MASSSRSKRTRNTNAPSTTPPINPSNIHLQYLTNPSNSNIFERISAYPILQDRFVKFEDFGDIELETLLKSSGLFNLFSKNNSIYCYPFLVKLFYTNLTFSNPPQPKAIITSVKNVPITFNTTLLGVILGIPNIGLSLDHIQMDNKGVIKNIVVRGKKFQAGMKANSLQPLARIIARILSYNIIPKKGSFTYISNDLLKCVYAVMAGLNVNWARIIYNNLCKPCTAHNMHGNFLTHVFKYFEVNLSTEVERLPLAVIFDKKAIKRMGLFNEEPIVGDEEDEMEVEEEEEEEEEEQEQEGNVDYQALVNQMESLDYSQKRLVASHHVLHHQVSRMRSDQEAMLEYQKEMLNRFNQHFPPPPPPQ